MGVTTMTGLADISIVIPTFNRPDTLRRSVESVLAQTYENIEIVVVNDGGVAVDMGKFHLSLPRLQATLEV